MAQVSRRKFWAPIEARKSTYRSSGGERTLVAVPVTGSGTPRSGLSRSPPVERKPSIRLPPVNADGACQVGGARHRDSRAVRAPAVECVLQRWKTQAELSSVLSGRCSWIAPLRTSCRFAEFQPERSAELRTPATGCLRTLCEEVVFARFSIVVAPSKNVAAFSGKQRPAKMAKSVLVGFS